MNKRKIIALVIAFIASIILCITLFPSDNSDDKTHLNIDKFTIDIPFDDINKVLVKNEDDKQEKDEEIQQDHKESEDVENNDADEKVDERKPSAEDKSDDKTDEDVKPDNSDKEDNNQTIEEKPVEEEAKHYVSININVTTLLTNKDQLEDNKQVLLPTNGYLLSSVPIEFNEGDSVFDILKRTCKQYGLALEYSGSASNAYIEGIGGFYEFDAGSSSGWTYYVNGSRPNVACSNYQLKENDQITWYYVCSFKDKLS